MAMTRMEMEAAISDINTNAGEKLAGNIMKDLMACGLSVSKVDNVETNARREFKRDLVNLYIDMWAFMYRYGVSVEELENEVEKKLKEKLYE